MKVKKVYSINSLLKKVIAWRLVSILITLAFIYITVGDIARATWLTIALHTMLTVFHYSFEKLWTRSYE